MHCISNKYVFHFAKIELVFYSKYVRPHSFPQMLLGSRVNVHWSALNNLINIILYMTFLFLKLGCVEMLSHLNSGCIMYNVYDNAQLLPGKCYLDILKLIKCRL